MTDDWSNEETNEPLLADHRNFYKVEKWTKGGSRVERMRAPLGCSAQWSKGQFDPEPK
jgi:hypothetical protein